MDDRARQHFYDVMVHQQNQRQRGEAGNQVQSSSNQSVRLISRGTMEIRELSRRIRCLRAIISGERIDVHDLMALRSDLSKRKVDVDFEKGLKEVVIMDGGDVCGICLEETKVGDEVKVMECSHLFHSKCIFEWIKRKPNCPTCRHQMPIINQSLSKRRKL